jgi:hypothetical protein
MDGDGESVNVRLEIFDLRTRQGTQFTFKTKRTGSLDESVQNALGQLREFATELYTAMSAENPLQNEDNQ